MQIIHVKVDRVNERSECGRSEFDVYNPHLYYYSFPIPVSVADPHSCKTKTSKGSPASLKRQVARLCEAWTVASVFEKERDSFTYFHINS